MEAHSRYNRLFDMLCRKVGFALIRLQPQLFTAPLLRFDPLTLVVFPQSHRHSHIATPPEAFSIRFITTRLLNRLPVMSINLLIYSFAHIVLIYYILSYNARIVNDANLQRPPFHKILCHRITSIRTRRCRNRSRIRSYSTPDRSTGRSADFRKPAVRESGKSEAPSRAN